MSSQEGVVTAEAWPISCLYGIQEKHDKPEEMVTDLECKQKLKPSGYYSIMMIIMVERNECMYVVALMLAGLLVAVDGLAVLWLQS